MNTTEVKGNWNEQKGKLTHQLATLTDNHLMFEEGRKDEMLEKIQIKLCKMKEELQNYTTLLQRFSHMIELKIVKYNT